MGPVADSAVDQAGEGVVRTLFEEEMMPGGERAEIVGEIAASGGRLAESPDARPFESLPPGHGQQGE